MRTTDGICVDKADNIYVADFSNNAIAKVTPAGVISVLAQNGDTGGRNGDLNEPGEPIVWNGMLVVSNFDAVMEPDKVNEQARIAGDAFVAEAGMRLETAMRISCRLPSAGPSAARWLSASGRRCGRATASWAAGWPPRS